ncbi:thioesterase II family protein [Micromonospora sp. NPDC000089]|uniref:thioesterase II family protein n=1 Tax=unclassified Micromonospora TaxID=2617518 RepID=UPI00369FC1B8
MHDVRRWVPWHPPRRDYVPDGVRRLYCFPHAGGAASAYLDWSRSLTGGPLQVCPVELPGRGTRMRERPALDMADVISEFVDAVFAPGHPQPFALFGHSLGACLAYETARQLAARGLDAPVALLVSGARPPGSPLARPLHELSDERLFAALVEMEGTPKAVLEHEELLRMTLPVIRADLTMLANYDRSLVTPLDVPISAYGGESDQLAGPEWLSRWRVLARRSFTHRTFAGGHFFLQEHPVEFRSAVGMSTCAA